MSYTLEIISFIITSIFFETCDTECSYLNEQGCHGQGKVREKQKFFKVREKSGNFAKGHGKSQFLSKSVKSQGILFSGFVKFMKTFSFGK